jgi:hypothetical protein
VACQVSRANGLLRATVTPLASIFGSGFLIIVPVLERGLGGSAVLGVVAVCILAWLVGEVVRHNVRSVEQLQDDGALSVGTRGLERLSDALIMLAYVISVALYLRILAQYLVGYLTGTSDYAEQLVTIGAVAFIAAVGITKGFRGLSLIERVALGTVLVLTVILGVALFAKDLGEGITIPSSTGGSLVHRLRLLGGVLITVQGFETVRYLADKYDRRTRLLASQLSQLVSTLVYVVLVAVATPVMIIDGVGGDRDLLDLVTRTVPYLALPLVLGAVLSQFAAAIADTVAARGNLKHLLPKAPAWVAYAGTAVAVSLLVLAVDLFTLVVIASRAFAAYYCVQSVVAARTASGARRYAFVAMATVLLGIVLFAKPIG